MLPRIVIRTTGRDLPEAARQVIASIWCGAECGNWPAKTADECTFCPRRNIAYDHLDPIQRAQLRATRPDLCPKEEGDE